MNEGIVSMGIWRLLLAIALLAYLFIGVQPHAEPPPPGNADLFYHALLNAVLAGLAWMAFSPGRPFRLSLVGLAAAGALIELVQMISPNREPSFADFGADVAGLALVAALVLGLGGCTPDHDMDARNAVNSREIEPTPESRPFESGHAPVNGIEMYYELHGRCDGVPLVLLHGGGSTIDVSFGRVLPIFAANRRVIALEEQGHGRTTDRDAPVAFESSADDVAALLRFLKIEQADLFGFSNGASVALQVAIRHPALVRKLVFASSMTKRSGAPAEFWEFMQHADFSNMPQPLKDAFLRVNPDEQKLRTMHDKDAARMQAFQDVPDELVRSVRAPTLIVLSDHDIVSPAHALELTHLISGARLLILPGGHGDYLGEAVMTQSETRYPGLTAGLIGEFLDAP